MLRGQDAHGSPSVLLSSGCTFATALRNALHHTVPLGRIRALKLLVGEVAPVLDVEQQMAALPDVLNSIT
jgi:hypothetical protein